MKKTWRKSSEALVERFSQAVPPDPRIERRQMFGYPAAFAGGNLFMSLFEESMIFRLSEPHRAELLSVAGARLFEPMPGPADARWNMHSRCLRRRAKRRRPGRKRAARSRRSPAQASRSERPAP